jgi:cobalt-zinc-cadmium efflux system outer membrane protein
VKLFLFVCFAVATASLSAQSESGSLRLDQVLAEARERNPRLRALRAAAEAADHREPEASTLPDPMLQLGVMNFGVPELNTDMAMSMAPAVQLMQMVPFPGKLSLRGEIAGYGSDIARSTAEEGWWEVRAQTATLFYELYALDRRLEVMRETLALLEDFQDVAKTMYSAGTGRQADVLRWVARWAAAAARLNAVLDRPASSHVPSPLLDPLPVEVPTAGELSTLAQESRPRLAHARLGLEQARSGSKLAAKEIWPDFAFGISYGQRNRGMGTERMASAMIGFSLPVHAGSRQHARRDEAIAMERLAEAQLRGWEAEIDARIGEMTAELERSRSLAVLYRDEVIPEARATVESAFSSYRVGTVDFMTLVDAQMTVNRYEGELFTLLADYGKAIAALESAVGRALPRTGNSVTEER